MRNRGYWLFVGLCVVALAAMLALRRAPLDWTPTFTDTKNTPFATELLAETLPSFLPGRTIVRSDVPTSTVFDTLRVPSTVILVTPSYNVAPATMGRMLAYLRRGGTVILATESISPGWDVRAAGRRSVFADSLGLRTEAYSFSDQPFNQRSDRDSLDMTMGKRSMRVDERLVPIEVHPAEPDSGGLAPPAAYAFAQVYRLAHRPYEDEDEDDAPSPPADDMILHERDEARYEYDRRYRDSLDRADSLRADSVFEVRRAAAIEADSLSYVDEPGDAPPDEADPDAPRDTLTIGVRVPMGEGTLVVFAAPRLLTNYGLLQADGDDVWRQVLAYASPTGPVVWDRYARPRTFVDSSPLWYLLRHEAFRPAWRTAWFAVLLAMAFRLRRRQRVIPVVEPPKNATVGFARVVSRLYYLRGDHAHLVRTLRRQFYAYARDTLLVNVPPSDEAFGPTVAARAASTESIVEGLRVRLDGNAYACTAQDLLALARDLDAFYAASPRGRN